MKFRLALVIAGMVMAAEDAPAQDCQGLIAGLSKIDSSRGHELEVSGRPGLTYKSLFDECDRRDTFGGRKLPRLQGMKQRCTTDPNQVAYIRKFPDGTIIMNAKMAVDADGSPVSAGPGASPADQSETWLEFDKGSNRHFVNAEDVPFVVVPVDFAQGGISFQKDTGIGKGDLAVVIKGDRCSLGVVGDAGPYFRLGEASIRAHADIGHDQCAVTGQHPCRRLVADGWGVSIPEDVTYVVFPGTRPKPLLNQSVVDVTRRAATARTLRFLSQQTAMQESLPKGETKVAGSIVNPGN